jgi:hypothetical protein
MDFAWTIKGGWQHVAHHENITAAVTVPMPDRTTAPITHQTVNDAHKTLGVVTCLSGNSKGSLLQMKEKTQKWLDSLIAGCLHHQMMGFSVGRQLWPLVKSGLCCNMATLPKLEIVLSLATILWEDAPAQWDSMQSQPRHPTAQPRVLQSRFPIPRH